MKKDIVIAGVGGQGIITIAYVLGSAALKDGLQFKQSEVHGMSQRGGGVESHLRIADGPIHSGVIPEGGADLILAVEPLEALRHLKFLAPGGTLLAAATPFTNIPNYPDMEAVRRAVGSLPKGHLVEADALAKQAGSPRCANIVMVGAASPLLPLKEASLLGVIEEMFGAKGEKVAAMNRRAFALGRESARSLNLA
jgi:indolepyruvate ferredoxin oxidoreductase beta subunit